MAQQRRNDNNRRERRDTRDDIDEGLIDKVIHINRVSKVVKGGRRFSFSALVVVGDGEGRVGVASGKANEVPEAIRKARQKAAKMMIEIPIINETIPHEIIGRSGAGAVLLKPASPGTGVIAGGAVRAIIEVSGIHNVLTKCLGSNTPHNAVHATMDALTRQLSPEEAAIRRGLPVEEMRARHKGHSA